MLPRDVSSMAGEPNRVAAWASASSWARLDHPAGQPDPGQRAVGGLVHLQRARAGVLVAGAGHHAHGTRSLASGLE